MTEQFVRKMEEGVKLLGIQLSEKQLEQFYDYFQFLVEKNKVMNQIGRASCRERV